MVPDPTAIDVEALLSEQPWVERLARALVRDSSLAEDLAQETWLAASRAVRPPREKTLRPFLAGVVRNLHDKLRRRERRRSRREEEAAPREALPSTAELVERAELQRLLVESVLSLAEQERVAILLRYFEGLSAEASARRSGSPSATVRSRIHRGLERLRERLEERVTRQDLFAGLLALARGPGSAMGAVGTAAAGSALPLLGGIVVMKTLVTLAAVCVALATFAAGFWFLGRDAGDARAELARPGAPAELAIAEKVAQEAPASEPEPGVATRLPVETEQGTLEPAPAEAPTPRAPRLDGRVVDERGFGIRGAAILEGEKKLGESGPAGGFQVDLAEVELEATAAIELAHPRYARKKLSVRVAPGARVHLGDVALVPAGAIAGWVEDSLGRRIGGAKVIAAGLENPRADPEELRRQGPLEDDSTVSAACAGDGDFRIDGVPAGAARLWAGAEGFAWSSTPIEIAPGETIPGTRLVLGELRREDRIAGVVLDPDGDPVAGASVFFWFTSARSGSGGGVEADAEGRFEILLSQRVAHDLSVGDPENRWSQAYAFDVEPGTTDLEVRFLPERWIDVTVTAASGGPLAGFELDVQSADPVRRTIWMDARYDEPRDGRTRLRVPNAPFRATASLRGYERAERGPLEPDALPAALAFELRPLPGIHGLVLTSAGDPAAGARILLREWAGERTRIERDGFRMFIDPEEKDRATSDAEGRFTLYPDAVGEYLIEAEAEGYALTALGPRTFDPEEGVELELRLVQGGAIEGRAIVAEGMQAAGIVLVFNRGDGRLRTVHTGPEGAYRLEGLAPGPWEVRPSEHDLDLEQSSYSFRGSRAAEPWEPSCEVQDGATTRHDVDLTEWAPGTLEGRLELAGRETRGWSASLERVESPSHRDVIVSASLAADGCFRLGPARAGAYTLVLRGPNEAHGRLELSEALSLASGANAWSLELDTGRLEGAGASPRGSRDRFHEYRWERTLDGRALSALVRIVPSEDGRFVLPTVPAGQGRIQRNDPPGEGQRHGRWEQVAEFEVQPGGVQRVELP